MGINRTDVIRSKTLSIKDKSKRSNEEIGFDDMVAITLGDKSKVLTTTRSSSGGSQSAPFAEVIAEEDKVKRKYRLILALIIVLIVVTGILIHYHREQIDGKIRVNYSSKNFEGSNYEDVIAQLKKQGFTNIKTEKHENLITGWLTKDGEVESVSIDGFTSFSSNSRFLPDVEIVITYHTFSSD